MTGEYPIDLEVMKAHYKTISELDVPGSDVAGVLDRVKAKQSYIAEERRIKSEIVTDRDQRRRMLVRHLFYDLKCTMFDSEIKEVLKHDLEVCAVGIRRMSEQIIERETIRKANLHETSEADWYCALNNLALQVSYHHYVPFEP